MKTDKTVILFCLLVLAFCLSCRMLDTLGGNERAGTVDRLWSDVPAFEDATKADLAIPLGARLIIRAAMRGKINFIAFTTNRSAQEVRSFYTKERMKAAGWTAGEEGCIGDMEETDSRGAVCFFNRQDGGREEGLAIILAQDEKSGQTDIFYARIDLTRDSSDSASFGVSGE